MGVMRPTWYDKQTRRSMDVVDSSRPWQIAELSMECSFAAATSSLGGRFRPVTAAALSSISIINGGTQRRIKFRRGSSLIVGRRMASTSSFDAAAAAASSAYSSFDLSGKTALITGSSGGIGKAMWHWHSPRPVPMLSCITIHEERVLSLHSEKSIVVIVRW